MFGLFGWQICRKVGGGALSLLGRGLLRFSNPSVIFQGTAAQDIQFLVVVWIIHIGQGLVRSLEIFIFRWNAHCILIAWVSANPVKVTVLLLSGALASQCLRSRQLFCEYRAYAVADGFGNQPCGNSRMMISLLRYKRRARNGADQRRVMKRALKKPMA